MHRVVVVAGLALFDNFIADRYRDRFQGVEQTLDIGGRDAREQLRLQQGHQPVARLFGLNFFYFDATGEAVIDACRAVQTEQLFKQTPAHP